jgi:hypothetical protein
VGFSMMRRLFSMIGCVFCILLMAACRNADPPPQEFGGTWTMRLGDRIFLVLVLSETGDKVTGTLALPAHFQIDGAGRRFSQVAKDAVTETITSASIKEGHLRFVTVKPKDQNDTSNYELAITGKDQASLRIVDAPLDAWLLTRVPSGETATVSRDWDPQRSYQEDDNVVSNPEMQKIYEADQKPRQNPEALTSTQWEVIGRGDAERRNQTAKLLADGQLHTGEDYKQAALVFQHGSMPDDYLLAHTLSMIAVAKGDPSALWIATATLDRYLQSTGKPQIYGTQFKPGKEASQEPFNRNLISDSLRLEMGVPSLAAQQDQYKILMEQLKSTPRKP